MLPSAVTALPRGGMTVQQRAAGGPEPIRDQRRVASNGVRDGPRVHVCETTLPVELPDGETRVFRRTTDDAVRSIKGSGHRPLTLQFPRPDVAHQVADRCRTSTVGSQRGQPGDLSHLKLSDHSPST